MNRKTTTYSAIIITTGLLFAGAAAQADEAPTTRQGVCEAAGGTFVGNGVGLGSQSDRCLFTDVDVDTADTVGGILVPQGEETRNVGAPYAAAGPRLVLDTENSNVENEIINGDTTVSVTNEAMSCVAAGKGKSVVQKCSFTIKTTQSTPVDTTPVTTTPVFEVVDLLQDTETFALSGVPLTTTTTTTTTSKKFVKDQIALDKVDSVTPVVTTADAGLRSVEESVGSDTEVVGEHSRVPVASTADNGGISRGITARTYDTSSSSVAATCVNNGGSVNRDNACPAA